MNTLPADILRLIDNYINSYETILLGFQLNADNFDIKWFLYNHKSGEFDGPEVLKLVQQKGKKFLEYLIDNKYLYGCYPCDRFMVELFRLAIKLDLDGDRLDRLASAQFYNYLDLYEELCLGNLKYKDTYDPQYSYKYWDALVMASPNTVNQIIKRIKSERRDRYSTETDNQLCCYRYIVCKQYQQLSDLLNSPERLNRIDLVKLACRRNDPKALKIILDNTTDTHHRIFDGNHDYNQKLIISEHIETTEIIADYIDDENLVKFYFQNGYDGPSWQRIVDERPELLSNIYFHEISREDGFYTLKIDMIKTLFKYSKPSARELNFLKSRAKTHRLYDLFMYICELEVCF